MAQHNDRNRPSAHGAIDFVAMQNLPTTTDLDCVGDEELSTEADEPPDELIQIFHPQWPHRHTVDTEFHKALVPNPERRESLLTRALTGLEQSPVGQPKGDPNRGMSTASTCSNASVADLTSDGGITGLSRTNSPSPPLPPNMYPPLIGLPHLTKPPISIHPLVSQEPKDLLVSGAPELNAAGAVQESKVEAGLGRKRCITFACARKSPGDLGEETKPEIMPPRATGPHGSDVSALVAPRRPCVVKFACPTRGQDTPRANRSSRSRLSSPPPPEDTSISRTRTRRDSMSTVRPAPPVRVTATSTHPFRSSVASDIDPEWSESIRFHVFANSNDEEEEWMHEATAHRRKIMVDDVLRKEKAIRKMGEEAEEEALRDLEDEELDELAHNVDNLENDNISDDGNETDDEEGFADSDDESDAGSFWTPGRTTAATSAGSVEHIRPKSRGGSSESSIESIVKQGEARDINPESMFRERKHQVKIRPGTPDLPDSTDFVCGTLDEDRPLEDAYLSCMKERIRQKHIPVPQDIDPSFPTSEPEDEDELDPLSRNSEEHLWISGQLDDYDDGPIIGRRRSTTKHKSPLHSPKRLYSSPTTKCGRGHQSPTPRRLFHSPPAVRRMHSPPPARRVRSPPPTRLASITISPRRQAGGVHIRFDELSTRPGLTHAKSLPRTPNPLSQQYTESRQIATGTSVESPLSGAHLNFHGRGAIDIVKGLERKRQRRREKLLQKWCHRAGKDKERKPEPGQGAEKMKELGLEKAGKGKGGFHFGAGQQEAQYMLSV